MVASYLSTDIIVIVALLVVLSEKTEIGSPAISHADRLLVCLVLVGIIAFFIHFYWTKIGVSEIWNTTRWSSMRSSLYQTMGRFSGGQTRKVATERPLSGLSAYSEEKEENSAPSYSPGKKPNSVITSYSTPSHGSFTRANASNPVSSVAYQNPARGNYGTKIGQPMESTMIHNTHEYDHSYSDASDPARKQRF